MSAEAARRALSMTLRELVAAYKKNAEKFGDPVPVTAFGLSLDEAARVFSAYDEDYHISRFFQFIRQEGPLVSINGIPATHIALDSDIESIL